MITFRGAFLVATALRAPAFFTFLLARLTQVGWLYLLDAVFWGLILATPSPSASTKALPETLPWMAVAGGSSVPTPGSQLGAITPSPTGTGSRAAATPRWRMRTSRTPG